MSEISPSTTTKQPDEVKSYTFDLTKELSTGETIQSADLKVWGGTSYATEYTSTMLSGYSIAGDGLSVTVGFKGGSSGLSYKITLKATTNVNTPDGDALVYEGDLYVTVVDL